MELTTGRTTVALFGALILTAGSVGAVDCNVPGSHATVQSAIDDTDCTNVVLADQGYDESLLINRSVAITGPAALADINGHVEVQGAGNVVDMTNIQVQNGCLPEAFLVTDGGRVDSTRLEVVWSDGGPCPTASTDHIFSDGFESSDTSRWSAAAP